jgi:hypothetical protein
MFLTEHTETTSITALGAAIGGLTLTTTETLPPSKVFAEIDSVESEDG